MMNDKRRKERILTSYVRTEKEGMRSDYTYRILVTCNKLLLMKNRLPKKLYTYRDVLRKRSYDRDPPQKHQEPGTRLQSTTVGIFPDVDEGGV